MIKLVYVGPTIPGVANRNTFFDGSLPQSLQTAIQETPIIGNLVIPINRLSDALTQIRTKSGSIYTIYQKALEYYGA